MLVKLTSCHKQGKLFKTHLHYGKCIHKWHLETRPNLLYWQSAKPMKPHNGGKNAVNMAVSALAI